MSALLSANRTLAPALSPPSPSRTSFIGREREVRIVCELVEASRLVTLTGAGGSGKTRLAAEVVRVLQPRFADGVSWIELAGVHEPILVLGHIASSLGIGEVARLPADALRDALRDSDRLLVLDNCEHVIDACVAAADLILRHCPGVRILTTSREALTIGGERAWLVPLLSVPDPVATIDVVRETEAVQLFVERARAANASFALTEANAGSVSELCRRLDGLPLAIELAAARADTLTPNDIVQGLASGSLPDTRSSVGSRHRTMREAIDWSYDLLDERERILLHRISIFAGEFSLEAAEVVGAGGGILTEDVLDLLAALVRKSLVVTADYADEVRYHLLETIRRYGRERLDASADAPRVQELHAGFFAALVRTAEPHFITPDRPRWVARIERELDDVRVVLAWTRANDASRHMELAGRLGWFWYSSGYWTEGRRWLEGALEIAGRDSESVSHAAVLFGAGVIAALQGQGTQACVWLEACVAIARERHDHTLAAYADSYIGIALGQEGLPAAEAPTRAALDWFEQTGDLYGRRLALVVLATLHVRNGDLGPARSVAEEAVRVARIYGLGRELGIALQVLGTVMLHQRELDSAAAAIADALRALRGDPQPFWLARALELLGVIENARGRPLEAARLFGAAERRRERMGAILFRLDRERLAPVMAAARGAVGDEAFDAARAAGRVASFEAVVDRAIESGSRLVGEIDAAAPIDDGGSASRPSAFVEVRLLGRMDVRIDGAPPNHASWKYTRPRELFALLALHDEGCTRDEIKAAMWPDASAAQAKNNFHVTLHHLRRALGRHDVVLFDGERYAIDRRLGVEVDARAFERQVVDAHRALRLAPGSSDAAARVRAALTLYRGDLLADDPVGDWHLSVRDRLYRLWEDAASALGRHLSAAGAHAEAAELYRGLVQRDELDETAHRQLIAALAAAGERGAALRQYERLASVLERELGSRPSPDTERLRDRIRRS